jgi:hypothetical protein
VALGHTLTSLTEITFDINLVENMGDDMKSVVISEKAKKTLLRIEQIVQNLRDRGLRVNIIYSRSWDG